MSTISNLGGRWPSLYTGQQSGSKSSAVQKTQDATPAAKSGSALDLDKRVASVGNATVDYAQDFVSSFAQTLFGDKAKGATIDFDSASLEASSSYAAGYQHTEGANGVSDAAAFSLTDSSHFIGKGTITTADGRKFDFEVEVQYNYQLDAAASQTSNANTQPTQDSSKDQSSGNDLPTVQLPNLDFPGTLADLFKLIGRDLQTALATSGGDKSSSQTSDGIDRNTLRSLSLRLLNLVDSKDTNTYTAPTSADKAKAAAAGSNDSQTATPAPAETPAAADAAAVPAAVAANAATPTNSAAA
ncbi:hypothetical protein GTP46_28450 [Duganella sp. FT135W]|uniref:Uncharacterized protein n=1 Tax=Duganella flavida TaxID=2692175 RepID=A0A6L8KL89_9BURK|nr:hypothetical protein [Duganella flavida]MYM26562.1 hypothetical protein [Duganella flavida]